MAKDDESSARSRENHGFRKIPAPTRKPGASSWSSSNGNSQVHNSASSQPGRATGRNHPHEASSASKSPRGRNRGRAKKRRNAESHTATGSPLTKKSPTNSGVEVTELQEEASHNQNSHNITKVLSWYSPMSHVPLEVEESLVNVLVRWKKKERGMFKNQPTFRLDQLNKKLRNHGGRMLLSQALSLRRHHMKLLNPSCPMSRLGLGSEDDIRECARLFEKSVEDFLIGQGIELWTEEQQKEDFKKRAKKGEILRHTPDFLVPDGGYLHIRKTTNDVNNKYGAREAATVLEEKSIRWLEVKMFYGASTIPHGTKGAVGSLMATARKYLIEFGPGALLFMYGCGEQLAADLTEAGVIVLDCSGGFISLESVQEHQRTWCANDKGDILP